MSPVWRVREELFFFPVLLLEGGAASEWHAKVRVVVIGGDNQPVDLTPDSRVITFSERGCRVEATRQLSGGEPSA